MAGYVVAMARALPADEASGDSAGLAAHRRAGESERMEWADARCLQSHCRRGCGIRANGFACAAAEPHRNGCRGRIVGSLAHAGGEPGMVVGNLRSHAVGAGSVAAELVSAAPRGWVPAEFRLRG